MSNENGSSFAPKRRGSRSFMREKEIEAQIEDLLPEEDNKLGRAYDSGLVKRLAVYLRPYSVRLLLAIVSMIISSLLAVSQPLIIGKAIDDGIRTTTLETLRYWSIVFLVVSIGAWITNRFRIALMAYVGTSVVADFRSHLFRHLHTLSLSFFNNYSVGRLMSRLISDIGVVQDFITWSITGLFRSAFMLTGIVVAMFLLNWRLALVTFSVLPLMAILTNYWRKHVRIAYRATRQRLSLINGYLNESITGIRVTKSFSREEENFQYFDSLNRSYFSANVDATRLSAIFFPSVDFMGAVATALVVGVGGWLVLDNALTAGVLVAFVLYVNRFFEPIRELAQRYNVFQATMAASERVFNLLDIEPAVADLPQAFDLPTIHGLVKFQHVSFGYGDDVMVLRDLNIRAEPGQRIALVGETGAGKSTIIRLLARFFDVDGGAILVDGYDIGQVTQSSLRRQMGIVLQDT
ncbi:MAG: ABC transporter ATP-binding protein, partial [Candidatus Promineifilaceae bacterium]|nr:ABC transporter ATP-binding protein [Candidatus Promineifilaceae bacterium]